MSNSTLHGSGYLEHCAQAIQSLLGKSSLKVLFFPFALADHDGYAAKARKAFESFGYSLSSAHEYEDKKKAIQETDVSSILVMDWCT